MALVKLKVYPRETTGKNANRRTRAGGHIPAIIYGGDREATNVQVETAEFERILKKTGGRSVIFDLAVEGESDNPIALVREMQQHPVTDEIRHIDLMEIPRGVPVEVSVPISIEGEPQAVKFGDAEVNQLEYSVTLSCLPRELPEAITVDIGALEINDSIYVKDVKPPVGEITDDPELQLVVIKPATVFAAEDEEGAEAEVAEGAEGETKGESGSDSD